MYLGTLIEKNTAQEFHLLPDWGTFWCWRDWEGEG